MMKLTHKIALMTGTLMLALSGASFAGVAATKHNLGTTANTTNNVNYLTSGTGEVCVFCHTPHAGSNGVVPLWNRALASTPTAVYNSAFSSTIDGDVNVTDGISLACLSCHDGTQAMDTFLNAPGSGTAKTGTYTWVTDSTGKVTGVANLGTDLQNDHPVGIQYGGGGLTAAGGGAVTQTAEFNTPTFNVTGAPMWYFNGDATAGLSAGDIRLYNRDIGNGAEPLVECATCHDPHTSDPAKPTFLRVSNSGSAVCVACHIK